MEVTRNLNDRNFREREVLLLAFARVRVNGSRDQLVWRLNARRTFSMRSFYNHLIKREVMGINFPFRQI